MDKSWSYKMLRENTYEKIATEILCYTVYYLLDVASITKTEDGDFVAHIFLKSKK